METIILIMLAGFGAGYFTKARDAKAQIGTLDNRIHSLQHELNARDNAEAKRRRDAAHHKRVRAENDVSKVENQIRFVSGVELCARRPVNREAVKVLYTLENWVKDRQPQWRIAFEVSMGAFIKTTGSPDSDLHKMAFSSFNSKRVDFLLINRNGDPQLVVEYHGSGHYLSDDASDRMKVKRLALNRAGIPLVEVPEKTPRASIKRMLDERIPAAEHVPPDS